jgi:hypothetical protein
MNKKGDISLNIIIMAAVGLLVLVILSVIFIGKMGITSRGVDDCSTKGGVCKDVSPGCDTVSGEKTAPVSWKCFNTVDNKVDNNKVCCLTI